MRWFQKEREPEVWEEPDLKPLGDIEAAHKIREICASASSIAEKMTAVRGRNAEKEKAAETERYQAAIKRALEIGAASVIVAHNHPSGEPKPSRQDIAITKQLIAGGNALNIAVHDHFIIASSGWTSLRAEGLI